MRSKVSAFLVFAFATVEIAGAAEAAKAGEEPRREQAAVESRTKVQAANSPVLLAATDPNDTRVPIPQMSANTNAGAGLPRLIETNPPVGPRVPLAERPTGAESEPRNPLWGVLAVLAVLAASFLLQRWRARSDPP